MKWLTLLLWAVGLAILAVGLYLIVRNHNSSSTQTSTTPPSTVKSKPPPARPTFPTVNLYKVQRKTLVVHAHPVRSGSVGAATALAALHVPGTVTIVNGTCTVQGTTKPSAQSAAEIVWTLTQFDTIKRVKLPGYGATLTRADEARYAPPILLEAPIGPDAPGKTFHVKGTATVFEGTLVVRLEYGHGKAIQKTVTATAGAPDLGTFDTTFNVTTSGPATLLVYSPSAQNGTPQHEVSELLHLGT